MNNKKTIYAVCLLLLVTVLSIGYALISGTLNINGNAKVTAATWDIYFKNVEIKDGSVTATQDPTITDKTSLSYNINLEKPGDYFEFNVDVVNNGMLDAMIDKITITPDISDKSYLSYTVKYLDDSDVEEKDILNSKKARTIKVRAEYKKEIDNNELNSSERTLSMSFEMKYVQADATGKEPTAPDKKAFSIEVVTGDGTNVGDEIAIGDEHFYVISNDGENIIMLSKYNLLVGNQCDKDGNNCVALTNPTGIQDESAKGYDGSNSRVGVVPFSVNSYWGGVSSGTYVYNNNASIKQYVDNYQEYLESFGIEIIESRLITRQELTSLSCGSGNSACATAPSWIYLTQYWTASTYDSNSIWYVSRSSGMYSSGPKYYQNQGVRPVIVISSDAI